MGVNLRVSDLGEEPVDFCIVGAGAAGLTLAAALAGRGRSVVVLEAGGAEQTAASQNFYAGEVADPAVHWPLDVYRVRALGGTSRLWGGRVIPYDPIDFEARSWVPHSGWPIGPEALAAYYPAALAAAEGGQFDYAPSGPIIPGLDGEWLATTVERFSRPTDFWARCGKSLASNGVRVIAESPVTAIRLGPDGRHVDHIEVREGDERRKLRARTYVLAMGGLETARLLMASNDVLAAGIGNGGGWLGRGYMCHLAATFGEVRLSGPPRTIGYGYERDSDGIYLRRRIALSEAAQRALKVLNFTARLHIFDFNDPRHGSAVLSAIFLAAFAVKYEYSRAMREGDRSLAAKLRHAANIARRPFDLVHFARTWGVERYLSDRRIPSIALYSPEGHYPLEFHSEQAPNRESRVTLSDQRDAHGVPRLRVDWQVTPLDFFTVREAYRLMARELERTGTGTLTFDDAGLEAAVLSAGAYGGHHSGTARMAASPADGVVDPDCRVHGISNLYLASGAVLPTSSQANPTLTILALALRLGDHLLRHPDEACAAPVAAKGRVLVIGAGGYVGAAIVRRLTAEGFAIRAGTRGGLAISGASEAIACDVLDSASLAAALKGVVAVVNCAVGPAGDVEVIQQGTRNLLAAARAHAGLHVVQISSVAVQGKAEGLVDELTVAEPLGSYGAAKLDAEQACAAAAADGLAITIVRPTLVWGPDSPQWTVPFAQRLRSGRWHALGAGGEGTANLVHVDDVAGCIAHLLGMPAPGALALYTVNGRNPPTWNTYLESLGQALGLPPALPPRRFPRAALAQRLALRLSEKILSRILPPLARQALAQSGANFPSRDEAWRFAARVRYDTTRLEATGFHPKTDFAEGIAQIAALQREETAV